jgi:hypothetical protein
MAHLCGVDAGPSRLASSVSDLPRTAAHRDAQLDADPDALLDAPCRPDATFPSLEET